MKKKFHVVLKIAYLVGCVSILPCLKHYVWCLTGTKCMINQLSSVCENWSSCLISWFIWKSEPVSISVKLTANTSLWITNTVMMSVSLNKMNFYRVCFRMTPNNIVIWIRNAGQYSRYIAFVWVSKKHWDTECYQNRC